MILTTLAFTAASVLVMPTSMAAECRWVTVGTETVAVGSYFVTRDKKAWVCDDDVAPAVGTETTGETTRERCVRESEQLNLDSSLCIDALQAQAPAPQAIVTPSLVLAAFRRTPVPAATLQVQPPNGRTLVNFDTNFFTVREPFTRTVTLLGQAVELRITPAQFTWRFGDGTETTTTTPGAAYPDLEVTHDYQRTGSYAPSVDTTYSAEWRLAGGAWQPVPGTVTIAGEPVALEAVESQPTLVSYG